MDRDELKGFLEKIQNGRMSVDEGISLLTTASTWMSGAQKSIRTGNRQVEHPR